MKNAILSLTVILMTASAYSQDIKANNVPPAVKDAVSKKFPQAVKISWEIEKGNYEANWGGRSGEDHSAQFTPSGVFVEIVDNIPVSSLPANIAPYVMTHYKAKIREAGKVTDARGRLSYEVEIKGKDLAFGLDGAPIPRDATTIPHDATPVH